MKRTPTDKEKTYLRELVGDNGEKGHYFGGTPEQRREIARERKAQRRAARREKAAAQVAEMRQVVGVTRKGNPVKDKPTPPPSLTDKVAAQVAAMRKAAGGKK